MTRFQMQQLQPVLLSILRIISGFSFTFHGVQKVFGLLGGRLPPFGSMIWAGGYIELIGGALLMLGLFTRPVAFVLSGMMAVAYFMAHAPAGFLPIVNRGELAVLYCFIFLYLSAAGAGPWSVDALMKKAPKKKAAASKR